MMIDLGLMLYKTLVLYNHINKTNKNTLKLMILVALKINNKYHYWAASSPTIKPGLKDISILRAKLDPNHTQLSWLYMKPNGALDLGF